MSGTTLALRIPAGETLLRALLRQGARIAHECGGVAACASCRVIVRHGLDRLSEATDDEDLLDRADALADSRLACQAVAAGGEFAIELPGPSGALNHTGTQAGRGGVNISEAAARHFAVRLAKDARCDAVRISVTPAGCSGFAYRVELANGRQDSDAVFESAGVVIVVDSTSLTQLQGTRIDLVSEGLGTQLRFENQNALDVCGCGKSFK